MLQCPDSFMFRYRAQRRDIWTWYWQRWRAGVWKKSVTLAFLGALLVDLGLSNVMLGPSFGIREAAVTFAAFCGVLFFLAIYPQMAFKSHERVFVASRTGIDSKIGAKSVHRAWQEISSVNDNAGFISFVVAQTGNAFVVPRVAFQSAQERSAFLECTREWWAKGRT